MNNVKPSNLALAISAVLAIAISSVLGIRYFSGRSDPSDLAERISPRGTSTERNTPKAGVRDPQSLVNARLKNPSAISVDDIPALARASLTPDEARILLDQCKSEIKNTTNRAMVAATIIGALCRGGYSEEAWAMIDSDAGVVRETQLAAYFGSCTLPIAKMLETYAVLVDEREKSSSLKALLRSRPGEFSKYDFEAFPMATALEKKCLWLAFGDVLKTGSDDGVKRALVDKALELFAKGKLDTFGLLWVLAADKTQDAFGQWKMLNEKSIWFKESDVENVRAGLARRLVEEDMERAMSVICSDPATRYSYPVISSALREMFKIAPASANQWVTVNSAKLDPATSQRIFAVMAQEANRGLDFETSRKWAEQVLNPDVRKTLIDQIEERQSSNEGAGPQQKEQ